MEGYLMEKKDITLTRKYRDREIVRRTLHYMAPVKKRFLFGIFIILINVLLNIFLPRIIGEYINALDEKNMQVGSLPGILFFCVSYFVIVVMNMVFTYIETIMIQKAGQTVIFNMRQEVFEKIETFSDAQLSEIPVGRLVTRVTNDTNSLNELYTTVLVNLLKYSLTLVGIIVNMVWINPLLSLYMGGFMVAIILVTVLYRHYSQIAFREERKQVSNLNTFLSENLSGMKVTQLFNQERRKKKEFDETNRAMVRAKRMVMFVFALYRPAISFLYFSAIATVFFVGFPMVQKETVFFGSVFNFGMLISFYNYTENFFGPIQNIAEQLDRLQAGMVASERIFNILDMEPTVPVNRKPIRPEKIVGRIEFSHVWFAYEEENWILKDVSFVVEPGQTVAFVGATGAGKTTILSLIVRNYDIQRGQILIDGIDIRDLDISFLRQKTGQMLQDVFMFSGTVRDNITLRDDDIPDEKVYEVISYVGADDFIRKLPEGLDTEVSERGMNFSSGQRQLISFARTVITDPSILILDEATANIDTETEVLIQETLEKMKSIGTMMVVAHRLSTIQNSDRIICLANGEVIESGTHAELLKLKGYYYRLYRLQLENQNNI